MQEYFKDLPNSLEPNYVNKKDKCNSELDEELDYNKYDYQCRETEKLSE